METCIVHRLIMIQMSSDILNKRDVATETMDRSSMSSREYENLNAEDDDWWPVS